MTIRPAKPTDAPQRVRLTPSNWIAIVGILLAQLGGAIIYMQTLERRLTALETTSAATVHILDKLESRMLQVERGD